MEILTWEKVDVCTSRIPRLPVGVGGGVLRPYDGNYSFVPHRHEFCELEIIHSGFGVQVVDGRELPVTAGDVYLLRGDCVHYFLGLHWNLWVSRHEIHQNPPSVKRQSGIIAPDGRFYSVCRLTAVGT